MALPAIGQRLRSHFGSFPPDRVHRAAVEAATRSTGSKRGAWPHLADAGTPEFHCFASNCAACDSSAEQWVAIDVAGLMLRSID